MLQGGNNLQHMKKVGCECNVCATQCACCAFSVTIFLILCLLCLLVIVVAKQQQPNNTKLGLQLPNLISLQLLFMLNLSWVECEWLIIEWIYSSVYMCLRYVWLHLLYVVYMYICTCVTVGKFCTLILCVMALILMYKTNTTHQNRTKQKKRTTTLVQTNKQTNRHTQNILYKQAYVYFKQTNKQTNINKRTTREQMRRKIQKERSNLVDSASSHTLVSKVKPCMSKFKYFTLTLRIAHYISYSSFGSLLLLG